MDKICYSCLNLDSCQDGLFCQLGQPIYGLDSIQNTCSYYYPDSDDSEIERRTNIYNLVNSLHHKS